MSNRSLDDWFVAEILIHEAALMRYLRRIWPKPMDVPELRQETYVRIYESAARSRPKFPKSFLFATARNLIADRVRRERVVSIDYTQDLDSLNVLIDEMSPEERVSARQDLKRLSEAFDQLSDVAREVIWLRRVEGLSQREAAQRLGMQEGALESHLCRGLRKLATAVFGSSPQQAEQDEARGSNDEDGHGQRHD